MPWELDIAVLRRFERKVLLPMPDIKIREEIFRIRVGSLAKLNDQDFKILAELTDGYSGSDISTVVNEALMKPLKEFYSATYFKVIWKRPQLIIDDKKPMPAVKCIVEEKAKATEGNIKLDLKDFDQKITVLGDPVKYASKVKVELDDEGLSKIPLHLDIKHS